MLSSVQNAPFDRIGGLDIIERAVAHLFTSFRTTPDLMPLLPDGVDIGNTGDVEWQVQLWLTDILGGPMKYDGPQLAALFGYQNATPEMRSRLGGLIIEALQAVGAPAAAVDEARDVLNGALAATPFSPVPGSAVAAQPEAQPRSEFAIAWQTNDPDFPIAWRDDTEAQQRGALIAQLKAQADEQQMLVLFPDANGEFWFGNVASEHAMARLADWLPGGFDPEQGVSGTLFFPDVVERRAIFNHPDSLPIKKRICFGPETVMLEVRAIRNDKGQVVCPQIVWEIFHTMAPVAAIEEPMAVQMTETVSAPARAPVAGSTTRPATNSPRLAETADGLRQEARAFEASARELLGLTGLLDTLADSAESSGSGAAVGSLAAAVADADGAEQMVQQGLAAFEAARSVADGPGRSREVSAALTQLMELARRTNQLVLDASQRAVEDEVAAAATGLISRASALRSVLATQVSGLAREAESVSRQLEDGANTAGRFAELREAMQAPTAGNGLN